MVMLYIPNYTDYEHRVGMILREYHDQIDLAVFEYRLERLRRLKFPEIYDDLTRQYNAEVEYHLQKKLQRGLEDAERYRVRAIEDLEKERTRNDGQI